MQVHVKTPHTEFRVSGGVPDEMLSFLKKNYKVVVVTKEDSENDLVNPFETEWYKNIKSNITPGESLKLLRENRGLTQTALGKSIDVPNNRISEYERGVRAISKEVAKRLAKQLGTSADQFI